MHRPLLLILTAGMAFNGMAQQYGRVWQFGNDVGLDFIHCTPSVVSGSNTGSEGCSSICDADGELLFYTNSETVWNQLGQPMPNGDLISGGGTLSQVLIVQKPLSDHLYYIITTTIQGNTGSLAYHVVDMSLNSGMGDVVSQNNVLSATASTEGVAATWNANGSDIWIMAHEYPDNGFRAYSLTSSGISAVPVISNVGPTYKPCNSNINARGEMKFSIDGSRLALAGNGIGAGSDSTNLLALFHFDPATGVVSDPLELPYGRGDFGLSFSPDGSKLYGATWKAFNFSSNDLNTIYQFDLSSNDPTTIINSKLILNSTEGSFGSLKLGPDGRIYVARDGEQYLGVINSPDSAGLACGYEDDGLYLNGGTCYFGLNNYIEYVNCGDISTATDEHSGGGDIALFPNPAHGLITIRSSAVKGASGVIQLADASGRIVMTLHSDAGPTYSLAGLSPGQYTASFLNKQGRAIAHRSFMVLP